LRGPNEISQTISGSTKRGGNPKFESEISLTQANTPSEGKIYFSTVTKEGVPILGGKRKKNGIATGGTSIVGGWKKWGSVKTPFVGRKFITKKTEKRGVKGKRRGNST